MKQYFILAMLLVVIDCDGGNWKTKTTSNAHNYEIASADIDSDELSPLLNLLKPIQKLHGEVGEEQMKGNIKETQHRMQLLKRVIVYSYFKNLDKKDNGSPEQTNYKWFTPWIAHGGSMPLDTAYDAGFNSEQFGLNRKYPNGEPNRMFKNFDWAGKY